jgi:ATP-dependent helicase/nuclease subunit B
MEHVAEEILHLVRDKGYHFRDITVVSRTLEEWGDRMQTVFGRYQIPCFLSQVDDILQKPVLTLLTAALQAVAGGYEYDDLFRYLKTGLTGLSIEDRDALENYVLCWDIRGSRWPADKSWSWHPRGYGQPWQEEDRELLARIDTLRRQVIAPLEQLRTSPAQTGRDWTLAVYSFLETIQLPECLSRRCTELAQQGLLQEAEEYRQVWQVLTGAMEQCADLLEREQMSLAHFADLFSLVLSQYRLGTIPVSLDRVTCGDMARISHATGKVLFLVGADDTNLPKVSNDTGLLTQEDRAVLARYGVETPLDQDQKLDREMLLIYECCTMPSDRLYVSYSAHGLDGAEHRPSFLFHRLQELFPNAGCNNEYYDNLKIPSALPPALDAAASRGDAHLLRQLAELNEGDLARRAVDAMSMRRENLSKSSVRALYHDTIRLSASRMDKVKSCHYAYFLQYGLKAKPRKAAGLDAPEAGTFVHYVLEYVLSEGRKQGGVSTLGEEKVRALAQEAAQRYIDTELGGMEDKTPRFRYLFRRLVLTAQQVVEQMVEELQVSDFQPIAFELGFGPGEELPPVRLSVDGITVAISGFVDRVDGWVHDNKLYLRVMDYKTGHKSFDLTDVWHGLNLQMLLYLFTLEEKGLPGETRPIVPAGVLYLPAREEHLSGSRKMDDAERRKKLDTKLRRSGLILNDPNVLDAMEHVPLGSDARFLPVRVSAKTGKITSDSLASAVQLGKLQKHIHRILRDIAREIGGGCIAADPWFRDEKRTACRFCDYASACHFEDGRRGERSRYLYPVKGTQFWTQLDEAVEAEQNASQEGEG